MRKLLLATTTALGLTVSAGAANATLTYAIWNDNADPGGLINFRSATFPVPTTDLFVTFTSTTEALNFQNNNPDGAQM